MDLRHKRVGEEQRATDRYGDTWVGGNDGPPPAEVLARLPYLTPGNQN